MTGLDWIIVAFVVLLAWYGALQGFIVGAMTLAGLALGAAIGSRIGPLLLPEGSASPYAPLFALGGALALGSLFATGLEGVGVRVRRLVRLPGLGAVDALLGALLTGCVALALAWVAGSVALQTPGAQDLRREVQRSFVLRQLNAALPPSGAILHLLARFDPLPDLQGPEADVPAPDQRTLADPGVRAAAASVVRITGTACGLGIEGSGWVAGDGLVVTNAHVVAGESDTTVQIDGRGDRIPARAIVFDPHDDVAVLQVPSLGRPALHLVGSPQSGTAGAILGYPQNGPFDARAARIAKAVEVEAQDAYGRDTRRRVLPLRGKVRSGNSGGPVVDSRGRVLGTIFATTVGSSQAGGYAVPNDIVAADLAHARAGRAVGTGACAE